MATLMKRKDRGGKLRLHYICPVTGRRYQVDTGTTDMNIAKLWLSKAEELIAKARVGIIPEVGKITADIVAGREPQIKSELILTEFLEKYNERVEKERGHAHKTLEANKSAFKALIKVHGDKRLDEITDMDIVDWRTAMLKEGKARATVGIYSRHLKAAFRRAVRWGLISQSPFDKVENLMVEPKKQSDMKSKAMSEDEIRMLLNAVEERGDHHFATYLRFLLYTGCRRGEILNLRFEDIDTANRKIRIYSEKTKKEMDIPINSALASVIKEMDWGKGHVFRTQTRRRGAFKEDKPWHKDSVSHWFQSYRDALGLSKDYSLHSLRHTYINLLISKGIPREIVHKLVGHSSERTTADYYDSTLPLHFRQQAELVNLDEPFTEET